MADGAYRFSVALKWDEGPESLKKLKNKLLLHFQSKKKSNGGECEIREQEDSRGYVLIHFKDEEVRDQVLQKETHALELPGGKKIKLTVSSMEAVSGSAEPGGSARTGGDGETQSPAAEVSISDPSGPREQDPSNVVLVENVPDSCPSEMLTILVENVSDRSEDSDFHLEIIPEIRSAVITFTCNIDISTFIQNFCSNQRVNQQKLSAKPLEETRSIRAEGIPPKTEVDHLIIYFESSKVGGGPVQKAVMIPEEEAAVVTFFDARIVKVVVGKQHIFGKKEISVYRYYPSLDIALYGRHRPRVVRPEPVRIQISPYLLAFILKQAGVKQNMEKIMSEKICEIKWPDPSCTNPEITLCFPDALSSHLRTMMKVVRTWTEEVSTKFSFFISRYKVIDCKMSPSAWEDIKDQISTAAYGGVLIKHNPESEKIFLAGTTKDVNKVEQMFRTLVAETSRKVERRRKVTTKTEPMSAALYHIIRSSGVEQKILDDVPELKMEYDLSTHNVRLTGLLEEVLQAKCDIMNAKQQLKSKSIQMDPHVLQFLMFADNDEVSCFLFARHKINAFIEIEENSIQLTGHSKKDLIDAQEQIGRELICQRIPVTAKKILDSPEWRSLQSHLHESLNSETSTVLIQEFPSGAENDVVLAGMSSNVHKGYKAIHEFVERNTPMQKNFKAKSMAVMKFIQEERRPMLDQLKQINVRVTISHRNIKLSGTKSYVEEASSVVEKLLSSVYHDTLNIDKPGAKKFCLSNEELYVTMAKNKYKCVLYLQRDEEEDDLPEESAPEEALYHIQLPQGVTLSVYRGDLCCHIVDVVVNAANEDLKHIGGLAAALLTAAGPTLQEASDRIVHQKGSLFPGDSVITEAGNLPCKQVIHTVGPRWNSSSSQRCKDLLQVAIRKSLVLAAKHGHKSIAIPAVSSGIFGFPIDVSAECIAEAIKEFMDGESRSRSITAIHLVDTRDETITAFTKSLKRRFGDQSLARYSLKRAEETGPQMREQEATAGQTVGNQNIVINVEEGFLQDARTDVIVNSVGKDLVLDSGGASKALSEKAGKQLQVCLTKEAAGATVNDGATFVTPGCSLCCVIVIHVIIPKWDGGKGSAEKIFRKTIQTCLETAEKRQLGSITFPAIGTGVLGFPRSRVATFLFDEVLSFRSEFLQRVTFILHPTDKETIAEFYKESRSRKMSSPAKSNPVPRLDAGAKQKPSASADTAFYGAVKTPTLGVHEMKVGSITYQVKTGDITKEDTEVIVNSTDHTFNLRSGVSKSILEAAGPGVQDECARLASQNKKSSHVTTPGGNLLCAHILHVVGRNSVEGVKEFVSESLREVGSLKASSVAFPAIGTGLGNVSAALVADIILDVVTEFAKSQSAPSLQTVKVVIFQQKMLNDFYTSMKKKEGGDLPKATSMLSRFTNSIYSFFTSRSGDEEKEPKVFELCENIEPAIFHLCAETKKAVNDTKSWLQDLILKEQHENMISDDWILEFDEQDHHTLCQDQRKLGVFVSFQSPGSTVKISGLTRDVLEMTNKIQAMINKVREKKTREREAELCSNLVEWRYYDGNQPVPFHRMANLELERAQNSKTQSVKIDISGVTYTVVMELKSMMDPNGKEMRIERVSKHGQFELPSGWTPMTNNDVTMVVVTAGSQEYSDVEAQFRKSCQMRIVNMERIQNKDLWMNYQLKKRAIDTKNGTTTNERRLFHGTESSTIKTVNQNGFNRSYAGKNAACYGNGTYFAVDSSYSAHDQYSRPDTNGLKYMYLARVLTGAFCPGQRGMLAPPAKSSSNITDLYDSVTDNPAAPTMFVIFHDIQAYPEYLITFSK
ncbi:protein mono-ADP-ribosyltransferase PARP14 isoform X1 [Anomaloglossus baeobatrachus]|uniref:protein mono-ADP-ribosyltransferase PARP14 isoform X1 n=1 Tax=Anomaloglossus baeobatrachus TaxID=238106 RepID=UPI003F4FC68A